jgi:predicted ATP-dependent Lon-type protease
MDDDIFTKINILICETKFDENINEERKNDMGLNISKYMSIHNNLENRDKKEFFDDCCKILEILADDIKKYDTVELYHIYLLKYIIEVCGDIVREAEKEEIQNN